MRKLVDVAKDQSEPAPELDLAYEGRLKALSSDVHLDRLRLRTIRGYVDAMNARLPRMAHAAPRIAESMHRDLDGLREELEMLEAESWNE